MRYWRWGGALVPGTAAHLPPGTIDDPNEALAVRIVPPAERLRLGGYYVPFTKKQRVQWFLDNLDTDEA